MSSLAWRRLAVIPLAAVALLAGGAVGRVQDQCGPFTDVSPAFCPYVLEMYYLGITAGTSPTTYSPDNPVTRGQAAVFVSKGVNQAIARSSRRAALGQWWTTTPRWDFGLGVTDIGGNPNLVASDGTDVWVANSGNVLRVRASDGRLLDTWTGATNSFGVLVAMGRILVTGDSNPAVREGVDTGVLYVIDPSQPAGPVVEGASGLTPGPRAAAFDGSRIWTTSTGGVSIVTPAPTLPWSATNVTEGFTQTLGIVWDGSSMWVGDVQSGDVLRLDGDGAIIQRVHTGTPGFMTYDGANIWVPAVTSVAVIRASDGSIVQTLTGNGLDNAYAAAFDGERILVTNPNTNTLSLFRAADLAPLGAIPAGTGMGPNGVCSDGLNFWVTLRDANMLGRF
jgi:S-layer homology domain